VQRARTEDTPTPPTASEPEPSSPPSVTTGEEPATTQKLRVRGRVVDSNGARVSGAKVEVRAWSGVEPNVKWFTTSTIADQSGEFEVSLDADRATIGFGVETKAKGYVEGWCSVKRADYDESRGVDVVVQPARAIVGRVIDADARPVAGTTVQLWYGSETTWPTKVDADGRFRTPPHAPRTAFELIVEAPGFARRPIAIIAADEASTDVGEIVLQHFPGVSGVVVDPGGQPVENLVLTIEQVEDSERRAPRCATDSAGRFSFESVPSEKVTIHAMPGAEGGSAGQRRRYGVYEQNVQAGRRDVRIVARPWATVTLKFVDALTGKPIDLSRVEYDIRYEGAPEPERLPHASSSTSPQTSTIVSVESGRRYDVTVRAAGYDVARRSGIDVADVAGVDIEIPLHRAR
jgi:protocatechuate 3,4-dioxygenase beta subunit